MYWTDTTALWLLIADISCQGNIGGTYDLGEGRWGERRGDLGPAGIAGITIGAVAVAGALAVTVFFCYYVHQKQKRSEAQAYGSHGYRKPAFQNY
ncbi:unnamed protein product [Oppiella nova]|uniref:Uncharacterized protein n=1 Tax=Oppiella nova TaxID=334625 RepID=A0A7R9M519_9ACAR|nr:unnamed protein product [Oppiella nova]CAG2170918.1 unnamed protein product [Oppiella nova]